MAPRILCLSGNPALDRRLRVASFKLGDVNRAHNVEALPGGKAAHVAMAALSLGTEATWVGFLGGAIGDECASALRELGIEVVSVATSSKTRMNLELIEDSGRVSELLEPGVAPTQKELANMIGLFDDGLAQRWKGALLVVSGSLPAGMPRDFYTTIMTRARAAGSRIFLDTSGEWLLSSLAGRPDFVKVNQKEAEAVAERKGESIPWALAAARELIKRGARSAAVTLGREGIVWAEGDGGSAWMAKPPKLNAISTVGCGDATLAGFAHAAVSGIGGPDALKLAAACGAANCLAKLTGRISSQEVQSLIPKIEIEEL